MKKYLMVLLALCMFFACSCGDGTDTETLETSDTAVSAEETADTEAATSESIVESSSEQESADSPIELDTVILASHNLQFYNEKNGIYNYCPSIIQIDENTRYIYYCTNKLSFRITDYIGCRKATRGEDGVWSWGKETVVLSPTANTWDARHNCDPSVVAGEFMYDGESYSYLMAYLGCTSDNSQDNKIGFAVAKNPDGPFVKVGDEPFVDFTRDSSVNVFQWGVGQASIINMDKKANILLFYTRGDKTATRTVVQELDLSDLSNPIVIMPETKLSESGLKSLSGGGDIINNADFVYDSQSSRFYVSSDCHPNPTSVPDYISSHFRITYFDIPESYTSFTWETLSQIGPNETGFARNHNTGILRDAYGHLPNGYITVYYTVSEEGNDSLWSYKIYDYHTETAE